MSEHAVTHATFSLERTYGASRERVFGAWADPEARAQWFAEGADHELDFRVGGREVTRGRNDKGEVLTAESTYRDISAPARIVYSTTLTAGEQLATVSITTVELFPDGEGTRLVLTEQDTYLDALELPAWREQGTRDQLDALGTFLRH